MREARFPIRTKAIDSSTTCLSSLSNRPPETGIGTAPHPDQFPHRHIPDITFLRQDHTDRRTQFLVRIIVHITPQDGDLAFQLRLEADSVRKSVDFPTPFAPKRQVNSPL